jgi:hypothetical protein
MITNIKNSFLFVLGILIFASCDDNETISSKIDGIYAYNGATQETLSKKGYPGDVVVAEGEGLQGLKSIVFDNLVDVVFNPALNSNLSFSFVVPFNELKGSKFGKQKITFSKGNGETIISDFEILQPKPVLANFDPVRPKVGTPVSVKGEWFYGITSVTFGGVAVDFTRVSATLLTFVVPANAKAGADVIVTTPGGIATKKLEIDLGFVVVDVTDFDGGGLRPNNNWYKYGDADNIFYSATAGISGNYAEYSWIGSKTNGYNGCGSGGGAYFLSSNATDANKVFFVIDVNCNGAVGTEIVIYLADGDGGNWAYSYVIATTGWQRIEAKIADFGANYDPSNQSADANPSQLNEVKISISENGPVPSKAQFDNLGFKVY